MKLSVLICSLQKRLSKFTLLAEHLEKQVQGNPVEILWLGDNKTMSVGEKRNKLLTISKGDYVCFVDDDDWVADDYIDEILRGIASKADCVTFNAVYTSVDTLSPTLPLSAKGGKNLPLEGDKKGYPGNVETIDVYYSLKNILNVDEPGKPRLRVPNHLIPMKREFALATMFAEKNFGEDTDYGLRVRRILKTEYKIEKPLYYYRFSMKESETYKYSPKYRRPASSPMIVMDVVIVSDVVSPTPPKEGAALAIIRDPDILNNGTHEGCAVIADTPQEPKATRSMSEKPACRQQARPEGERPT